MRLPRLSAAILASTAALLTLTACTMPTGDTVADPVADPVAPVVDVSPTSDPTSDTPTPAEQAVPVQADLNPALLEDGRFTVDTTGTYPTDMPSDTLGALDAPFVGARGRAGITCDRAAWVTTAGEHFRDDAVTHKTTAVEDHYTGGTVTLTATTPDGEQTLVEYLLPAPEDVKGGGLRWQHDLERLTDPVLTRIGFQGNTPHNVNGAGLRPGELVGVLAISDPLAPDVGTHEASFGGYVSAGYFNSFEFFAPNNPIPADAVSVVFSYELDGYKPVHLDVPVPAC